MTLRQLADEIVCAVLDADRDLKYEEDHGVKVVKLGDAVIEVLRRNHSEIPRIEPDADSRK